MAIKPVAFYVPRNFDPACVPARHVDDAHYFLNAIRWRWLCWRAGKDGYIRLHAHSIRRIITRDAWRMLPRALEAAGVVEVDWASAVGQHCRGYRILPRYYDTRRVVCNNPALCRRIALAYPPMRGARLPVHRWLYGQLPRLDFDIARARTIIAGMAPTPDERGHVMPEDEYRAILTEACLRIACDEWWLSCDKYGRVHTPLTSLATPLRCCLSVGGQALVGLDCANSQPLVAGLVARDYYRNRWAATRLRDRSFDARTADPYHNRLPSSGGPCPMDLVRYLGVCADGLAYESMMQPGDERDAMKLEWLRAMYCRRQYHQRRRLWPRLMAAYPSMTTMLDRMKRRHHSHPSHVMQNVESTIWIRHIAGRIHDTRPGTPCYTIHDSILTTAAYVPFVRSVIADVFAGLGVSPTIKTEAY